MNIFKASEVLKIAVQIEKNGLAFYSQVKEYSKSFPVQEVFGYLAKEEVRHQHAFESLLEKAGDYEPAESYPGELEMYMQAIAGENVFTKSDAMKQVAQKAEVDKEAIELGIGFEKDSIIFFSELKKFVPASNQGIVERIIGEEKGHLSKLIALRKQQA
jgi:rubrerythrin